MSRILVVDRESHIRRLIAVALKRAGHVSLVAPDSDIALSLLEKSPDLLITEVTLRPLDGFALLKTVRDHSRPRGLPVLLTGSVRNEVRPGDPPGFSPEADLRERMERTFGLCDYLVEPFNPQEMVRRVEALLARI